MRGVSKIQARYLPWLKRRLTTEERVLGITRELLFKASNYLCMDSKVGNLLPTYTSPKRPQHFVTVEEISRLCDAVVKIVPTLKPAVTQYHTEVGITEVINLASLELLYYQKQNNISNIGTTAHKLKAALDCLSKQRV